VARTIFPLSASVNGTIVHGKSHYSFCLNFLTELVRQNKSEKNPIKRLISYAHFFYTYSTYSHSLSRTILLEDIVDFEVASEVAKQRTSDYLENGTGVCQQFARILFLCCKVDGAKELSNILYCTPFLNLTNGIEYGHAVNFCKTSFGNFIIDISAMLHKNLKSSQDFCFVQPENYILHLRKDGILVKPYRNSEIYQYCFPCLNGQAGFDFEMNYLLCHKSTNELLSADFRSLLFDPHPICS